MIDDKKIEEAAVKSTNYLKGICDFTVINASKEGFKAGAKWAINEFLKDLSHPASEVPRNDNEIKVHFLIRKIKKNGEPYQYANEAWGIDYFSLEKVVE